MLGFKKNRKDEKNKPNIKLAKKFLGKDSGCKVFGFTCRGFFRIINRCRKGLNTTFHRINQGSGRVDRGGSNSLCTTIYRIELRSGYLPGWLVCQNSRLCKGDDNRNFLV